MGIKRVGGWPSISTALLLVSAAALLVSAVARLAPGAVQSIRRSWFAPSITLSGAPTAGNRDATVALVVFSDFQCPACGVFARDIMPEVQAAYVKTGKVELVFRHSPLVNIHSRALAAAAAAECAFAHGQFWPMHDQLFFHPTQLDDESLRRYASAVGIPQADFDRCLRLPGTESRIRTDITLANAVGIEGTPTLLIGRLEKDGRVTVRQRFSGAPPFPQLRVAIDQALAESRN